MGKRKWICLEGYIIDIFTSYKSILGVGMGGELCFSFSVEEISFLSGGGRSEMN